MINHLHLEELSNDLSFKFKIDFVYKTNFILRLIDMKKNDEIRKFKIK